MDLQKEYCFACMTPLPAAGAPCPHCGSNNSKVENLPNQLPCGTVLGGKYLIGRVLGQGGFGITYIGLDLVLQRKVAVKELYPSSFVTREMTGRTTVQPISANAASIFDRSKQRFIEEARVLAQFTDEAGIVDVRDYIEENGTAYFVMEYVDGKTLRQIILERGKLPAEEAINMLKPILYSLNKVHAAKLLHRDISPDNIMVRPDGTAVLLDFGAARTMTEKKTHSLSVIVKPGYAAPEQYLSKGDQGPWTDVYALCATLYKLVTGKTPPPSLDIQAGNCTLKSPSELGISMEVSHEEVLLKGLSLDPTKRQQDVMTLLQALNTEQTRTQPPSIYISKPPNSAKKSRRMLLPACIGLAVTLIVGAFIIVGSKQSLGRQYEAGKEQYENANYEEAVPFLQKAANGGIAEAQALLGNCFYSGVGVKQSYTEAVKWYRTAAAQGLAEAQDDLGNCCYHGNGVEQSYSDAVKWYRLAAEQGLAEAQNNLGNCCYSGNGVSENKPEAVKWYRLAAEQGYARAQYNLGNCCYNGNGVSENKPEAVKWYRLAAEQGLAEAQDNLGNCCYHGNGVEQSYSDAVKWYRLAAEQGYARAQNNLGNCCYSGNGVEQSYSDAVKWYRLAAEQGLAEAQNNLGNCCYSGNGVEQSYSDAVKWYRLAAEQGYAWAQYNLGNCCYSGNGVSENKPEAVKWYRLAAEQGLKKAQDFLGNCYYHGDGIAEDKTEAVKWYRLAAEQGLAEAQNNLGNCCYSGNGVSENKLDAVKWYRLAAEQGHDGGQFNLGRCYYYGNGVSASHALAREWMEKAAAQGNVFAKIFLNEHSF